MDIATGIAWAVERGAAIINLSLGGPGESPLLAGAVANARSKGVLVVAAAGNGGSGVVEVPARIPGVLAVSATNDAGALAAFSSYGPEIAVAAPGVRMPLRPRPRLVPRSARSSGPSGRSATSPRLTCQS